MANRVRVSAKARMARWQAAEADGGEVAPLLAHIRSYRSEERNDTNDMNQSDNLPLPVKLHDAIVNDRWLAEYPVVAELVVDADDNRGYHCFLIHTGFNNAGYQLGLDDCGETYGSILSKRMKKFPGVKVTRVGRIEQELNLNGPGSSWTNDEKVKITTSLNYDIFNDVDCLHKLQCCEQPTKADAVARKINKLIQRDGVEILQEIPRLGRELI